jgi:predicted esterase
VSAREHHLAVRRTARYYTLGAEPAAAAELWYVMHGYGQLAAYFIRPFDAIATDRRCVVAPEALNRFYHESTSWQSSGSARAGASWMTREDRLHEIADYLSYLDALHAALLAGRDPATVRVAVLGFSQGVATALRWACRGAVRADLVIAWAGPMPPDIDAAAAEPLRRARFVRVLGDQDPMAVPEALEVEAQRVGRLGLATGVLRYDGGHALDAGVIARLAG